MIVKGTALVSYVVELEGVEDISGDAMDMYDSDELIADAINLKMPSGFYVKGDIRVISSSKI